jgi:pilus assembly protein CpaB
MRRGRILILLGLTLAIGAAAVVFYMLWQPKGETETEIERDKVVVASQPIPEDGPVAGQLEIRSVPKEMVLDGALTTLDGTEDMLAKGPIPQGAVIYPQLIQTPEEQLKEGQLSQLVEEGYVAIAFPVSELSSVSYGIQPGDYVDVLMTMPFVDIDEENQIKEPLCPPICETGGEAQTAGGAEGQLQRLVAQLTLQDVMVLGVGRWTYRLESAQEGQAESDDEGSVVEPPSYITLMLQPQDALVLKLAREYGMRIDLAVRNLKDHQVFQNIQQVTLDYIMARFGINLPPKRNYTIEVLQSK